MRCIEESFEKVPKEKKVSAFHVGPNNTSDFPIYNTETPIILHKGFQISVHRYLASNKYD